MSVVNNKRTLSDLEGSSEVSKQPSEGKCADLSHPSIKRRKLIESNTKTKSDELQQSTKANNNKPLKSSDMNNKSIEQLSINATTDNAMNETIEIVSKAEEPSFPTKTSTNEINKNSEIQTNTKTADFSSFSFSSMSTNDNKQKDNSWTNTWTTANTNPDGSFKLSFDWGKFDSSVGYGTAKQKYTKDATVDMSIDPVARLNGAVDTGDEKDSTLFFCKCKIFKYDEIEKKYIEKGVGNVNVNTYDDENATTNGTVVHGRILARRDLVMSTMLNVQIFKSTKYENVEDKYLRFSQFNGGEQKCATYLLKPLDKKQVPDLLVAILKIQKKLI